ncbi:MAG: nucleotidyltransferase [Candidatus Melainabacteria bacterium RIFCSPHIGHO2_02_FULL_34_12]|nr:MAG: nucleotidyltransferase [Candidatus Melainabacteria bacterium RIFCSPHIGHO2_02_FULL_34_12]
MEKLEVKYNSANKALTSLKEILKEPFSVYIRDATIQRFEYTFEAFWKFVREYLKVKEGITSNSPKSCFKELFTLNITSEEETVKLQEMTDDRNETSHAYREEVAKKIFSRVKEYALLMEKVLSKLKV